MIQPRLSSRNICSDAARPRRTPPPASRARSRARARCGRRRPGRARARRRSAGQRRSGTETGAGRSRHGSVRPRACEVSIAMNSPSPSTTPPSIASPIRRLRSGRSLRFVAPVTWHQPDLLETCPRSAARSGPRRKAANSSAGWYMSTQPRSLSSVLPGLGSRPSSPSAASRAFMSVAHLGGRDQRRAS